MRNKLILGTRGSPLALAQSRRFGDELMAVCPGIKVELKTIVTTGDRIQNRFLSEVGGKGLFVKEIEEALKEKEIDFAVHSLKDMPADLPDGLEIACFPKRKSPRDVLVTVNGIDWQDLPLAALIGTSSLRRRLQISGLRADLKFEMLRGNIDTRMRKLKEGTYDAIVLAKAGMERLGLSLEGAVELPIVAAPGQGTLAIEIRSDDESLREFLRKIHDPETEITSLAERRVMQKLGGNCSLPLGVFAERCEEEMRLEAFLSSPDGQKSIKTSLLGPWEEPIDLADRLVSAIEAEGGKEILKSARPEKEL